MEKHTAYKCSIFETQTRSVGWGLKDVVLDKVEAHSCDVYRLKQEHKQLSSLLCNEMAGCFDTRTFVFMLEEHYLDPTLQCG